MLCNLRAEMARRNISNNDLAMTIGKTEMEYQEVFDIIGSRGEELATSDLGFGDEYYTVIFTWEGEGTLGANANVTFQGGKVTSKAQAGLE